MVSVRVRVGAVARAAQGGRCMHRIGSPPKVDSRERTESKGAESGSE